MLWTRGTRQTVSWTCCPSVPWLDVALGSWQGQVCIILTGSGGKEVYCHLPFRPHTLTNEIHLSDNVRLVTCGAVPASSHSDMPAKCVLLDIDSSWVAVVHADLMSSMYRLVTYWTLNVSSLGIKYSTLWEGHTVQLCLTLEAVIDVTVVHVCLFPPRLTCYLCTPHFLLIVPLYVLLGRCSVILSRAGCLYDPRTEIWLARPECLSYFPFPPSLPSLSSSAQVFTVTVHPSVPSSAAFCMPASPSVHPTQGWNKFSQLTLFFPC